MVGQLNRKLKGWAAFYQFIDFKAKVFSYIDRYGVLETGWSASTEQALRPDAPLVSITETRSE